MSSTSLPEPPEEPEKLLAPFLPSIEDCCGSACATCVYDIYDQQMNQYEKEIEEYKKKYGGTSMSSSLSRTIKSKRIVDFDDDDDEVEDEEEEIFLAERNDNNNNEDDDEFISSENSQHRSKINISKKNNKRFEGSENKQKETEEGEKDDFSSILSKIKRRKKLTSSSSKYEGSIIVNLSPTTPNTTANILVPKQDLLTFRMDLNSNLNDKNKNTFGWTRVNILQDDEEKQDDDNNSNSNKSCCFDVTNLTAVIEASTNWQSILDLSNPGDTVEILRLPSKLMVESFLRKFNGGGGEENEKSGENISSKEQKIKLGDEILIDLSHFPFVSTPFPHWLQKCNSLMRTQQHPRLKTSQQPLPLGHMMRCVVDVSSFAAIQRPLLKKMLDVAISSHSSCVVVDHNEKNIIIIKNEILALNMLATISVSLVHYWIRLAWCVFALAHTTTTTTTTKPRKEIKSVGNFLSLLNENEKEGNKKISLPLHGNSNDRKILPKELLDYELPFNNNDNNKNHQISSLQNIGSVEFILRCFPKSVNTEIFPSNPKKNVTFQVSKKKSSTKTSKILNLARLLEVVPPLRGRIFSVADLNNNNNNSNEYSNSSGNSDFSSSVTIFSNYSQQIKQQFDNNNNNNSCFFVSPPWSGIVSKVLAEKTMKENNNIFNNNASNNSKQEEIDLYMRRCVSNSSSSKNSSRALSFVDSSSSSCSDMKQEIPSFSDALFNLFSLTQQQQQQQRENDNNNKNILFLAAGTGLAPFNFFLSRMLRLKGKHSSLTPKTNISLYFGVRNFSLLPSDIKIFNLFNNCLNAGILSSVHIAASRQQQEKQEKIKESLFPHENFHIHLGKRVPELLSLLKSNDDQQSSSSSSSSPSSFCDVFSCGPRTFVESCQKEVKTNSSSSSQLKICSWINDDWSS